MSHVVVCRIAAGALPALKALRLQHLAYIAVHQHEILFGGPARDPQGMPQEMIIVVATPSLAEAQRFIAAEPYNASGQVFDSVTVRAWTQVVPDTTPGALQAEIDKERASVASQPTSG